MKSLKLHICNSHMDVKLHCLFLCATMPTPCTIQMNITLSTHFKLAIPLDIDRPGWPIQAPSPLTPPSIYLSPYPPSATHPLESSWILFWHPVTPDMLTNHFGHSQNIQLISATALLYYQQDKCILTSNMCTPCKYRLGLHKPTCIYTTQLSITELFTQIMTKLILSSKYL